MTVCLHTACGCVQWIQWPDAPRTIRIPLAPGARDMNFMWDKDLEPIAPSMKVRTFERQGIHRLPETRYEYVMYEEVPE